MITALQEGVTKHSDVFITDRYLKSLESDFCADLLKDTNHTLQWLDGLDQTLDPFLKRSLRPFTFDFKALYDSLEPHLVKEALKFAMDSCRPDWSENFKLWIINLLSLSLESSVGVFEDVWYRQRRGVPTGGTPCVQIANITVYYILHKVVYSNPDLMRNIAAVKRYIDDGAGCFSGTKRQFTDWINRVNQAIAP